MKTFLLRGFLSCLFIFGIGDTVWGDFGRQGAYLRYRHRLKVLLDYVESSFAKAALLAACIMQTEADVVWYG